MSAKIETVIHNGELIAATRELVQGRLEDFADADRLVKSLHVSVDLGNRTQPVVEIKAPIGGQELVSEASGDNVVQAVDDAIQRLRGQLAERRKERKERIEQQNPEDRNKLVQLVAGGALAAIVVFTIVTLFSGGPSGGTVSGVVTHNGQPLTEGMVLFANEELANYGQAMIGADGSYRVGTAKSGIPPCDYVVTVVPPEIPDPNSSGEFQNETITKEMPNIPEKYQDSETSPLKVSVSEGENVANLEMED